MWSDATGVVPTYKQSFAPERVEFIIKMSFLSDTSADNLPVVNAIGTTEKTAGKTTGKTTEKILCIIKGKPYVTYRELAEALGLTEDGIYWSVKQLRKQGLLRRIGGRKEGYWEVATE